MLQYFQILQNYIYLEKFFIFSDIICDLGGVKDFVNYGEYSGVFSEQQIYEYVKTILLLMIVEIYFDGKIFIVGGGIVNFINVVVIFKVYFFKVIFKLVIFYVIFFVLQN